MRCYGLSYDITACDERHSGSNAFGCSDKVISLALKITLNISLGENRGPHLMLVVVNERKTPYGKPWLQWHRLVFGAEKISPCIWSKSVEN